MTSSDQEDAGDGEKRTEEAELMTKPEAKTRK